MPFFECRTDVKASVEQLFEFLTKPANLQAISPPDLQLVFVEPPEVIELGSRLTCKAIAQGMVQQLTYEIVELESPKRIREKMVEGPLRLWLHDYLIEAHEDPEMVTLVNRIEFEPPGGLLGFLVTEDLILENLDDGFDYRRSAIQAHFNR